MIVDFSTFGPTSQDILGDFESEGVKNKGSIELFNHRVKFVSNSESRIELLIQNYRVKFVSNSETQTTATRRNVESDCAIVYEMSVSKGKRDQTLKVFPTGYVQSK